MKRLYALLLAMVSFEASAQKYIIFSIYPANSKVAFDHRLLKLHDTITIIGDHSFQFYSKGVTLTAIEVNQNTTYTVFSDKAQTKSSAGILEILTKNIFPESLTITPGNREIITDTNQLRAYIAGLWSTKGKMLTTHGYKPNGLLIIDTLKIHIPKEIFVLNEYQFFYLNVTTDTGYFGVPLKSDSNNDIILDDRIAFLNDKTHIKNIYMIYAADKSDASKDIFINEFLPVFVRTSEISEGVKILMEITQTKDNNYRVNFIFSCLKQAYRALPDKAALSIWLKENFAYD